MIIRQGKWQYEPILPKRLPNCSGIGSVQGSGSVLRLLGLDIEGAVFNFDECSTDVFAQDSQRHEGQTADEQDKAEQRRITRNIIIDSKDDSSDEVVDEIEESQSGECEAQICCESKRRSCECYDSVDRILEQLEETPLGLTGYTLCVDEFDPLSSEADPCEDTLRESLSLVKSEDRIDYLTLHQAEISGSVSYLNINHLVDQLIE